ncbi:hypothetical protein SLEP1_g56650 [Rubroshorea leprosula]|uniref:Carboxypeptidase n=1 Tax=Rubroshorea leprosula TaxID=152421 RepID=A0AAV5MIY4_9ROSI|nr:hypothetical protein SLEP1_g56650 [Rubroshorea leprosula]
MKLQFFATVLLPACLLALLHGAEAKQADGLRQIIKSRRTHKSFGDKFHEHGEKGYSQVYFTTQEGSMDGDRLGTIPGQPNGVNFSQYAGYITVDPNAGRALFYYFVESPENSSTNPLVLWLNGGPGCSSLGYRAMEELGPFRVNADGLTLFLNPYAWNNGKKECIPIRPFPCFSTTFSELIMLLPMQQLERFPQYKSRDFYITGESYTGHYVPQLAMTILTNNQYTNQTVINLKGIAAYMEVGKIDFYNIYAPLCLDPAKNIGKPGSIDKFDPCTDNDVYNYLNTPEVQMAFNAKPTKWDFGRNFAWTDSPMTILPIIQTLISSGMRVGGYVEEYEGLTFVTVRGSGHMVPSNQPERSLTMFSSFLQGTLPPLQ